MKVLNPLKAPFGKAKFSRVKNVSYQITIEGKEFMSWLVQVGRTHQRPN